MYRFGLVFLFGVCLPFIGGAQTAAQAAAHETESSRVVRVLNGHSVLLADGRAIRLAGLLPLTPFLARADGETTGTIAGFSPQLKTRLAKAGLEALVLGQEVRLVFDEAAPPGTDRYGRWSAHLYRHDGVWIQGEMLRQGWALSWSQPDDRQYAAPMLEIEARARRAGRGLWREYAVFTLSSVGQAVGRFALVEGRVVQAQVVGKTGFLNFGDDWRKDVTIRIPSAALARFGTAGIDVYAGHWVRVRGFVKSWNGPMIEIDHPERIEILDREVSDDSDESVSQ